MISKLSCSHPIVSSPSQLRNARAFTRIIIRPKIFAQSVLPLVLAALAPLPQLQARQASTIVDSGRACRKLLFRCCARGAHFAALKALSGIGAVTTGSKVSGRTGDPNLVLDVRAGICNRDCSEMSVSSPADPGGPQIGPSRERRAVSPLRHGRLLGVLVGLGVRPYWQPFRRSRHLFRYHDAMALLPCIAGFETVCSSLTHDCGARALRTKVSDRQRQGLCTGIRLKQGLCLPQLRSSCILMHARIADHGFVWTGRGLCY